MADEIAEYVYDFGLAAGIIVRELCPDMHTSGPTTCYREKANDDMTGWTVWASSVLLSRWILRETSSLAGLHIIELGSGCGLAGLVAATTNARSVALSDYQRDTSVNVLYNLARNFQRTGLDSGSAPPRGVGGGEPMELRVCVDGVDYTGRDAFKAPSGCRATLAQLDWDDDATWPRQRADDIDNVCKSAVAAGTEFATYDVVLASDLFYRRSYARKVATAALALLRPGGRLVCATPSAREGLSVLERMMTAAGWSAAEEDVPDDWRINPLRTVESGRTAP